MSMSQVSGRQSLRDIQSNLEPQSQKLYHIGAKPIARSTLARLNDTQPASLYEALFYPLLERRKKTAFVPQIPIQKPALLSRRQRDQSVSKFVSVGCSQG